jgi:glycosyltransferase involved in cell wall biosynthesis
MPTVDVIIPCYKYGHYLEGCVASVLSQEGVRVRALIIDDCSPDCTEEVGRRLAAGDARVAYRRHAVNIGHIRTYNEALAEVTADYCLILSADDLLTPGALLRAVDVMERHPEVGLTYGPDVTFSTPSPDPATAAEGSRTYRIYKYPEFLAVSCQLTHTPIQSPTAVVRTSLHQQIGFYLPELPYTGDTEIWLRMAAHAPVCELGAVQAFRRLHPGNMSLAFSPLQRLQEQRKAFQTHFAHFGHDWPDVARLEPVMNRSIAELAFWSGVMAYEQGRGCDCSALLGFAADISPEMTEWNAWRRFQWKRRLAPGVVWRWLGARHASGSAATVVLAAAVERASGQ